MTTLLTKQLVDCGLSDTDTKQLASAILILQEGKSPEHSWPLISKNLLHSRLPPAVHGCVHRWIFREWDSSRCPPPAWFPTIEERDRSNISMLMNELELETFHELYRWSIKNKTEFWGSMIKRLGIRFHKPFQEVLEATTSVKNCRWLVGAELNIADSCFNVSNDAVAIVCSDSSGTVDTWTYQQLESMTNRIVNGLRRAGLEAGDAIAICMPMTPESVAIYLGIVRAGCIVVSIADSFSSAEIATRLRIAKAKLIFTQDFVLRGEKRLPLYEKLESAQAPRAIVLPCEHNDLSQTLLSKRKGDCAWDEFISECDEKQSIICLPQDHTNYLFSSGTTGEPKAIPWTHVTPIKCAVDGFIHQDIQPGDVVAWPTNLGWMMGPWLIYASLINKASIALFKGVASERAFGQFVQDTGVNILGVIPSLVTTWKTTRCMEGLDWSAIKCFSSTGECSNADDMLYLMALAQYRPVIEYCGGTELAGAYLSGTLVQPQAAATFSTATLGSDLVILDDDGQVSDIGEAFLSPPVIGMSSELLNRNHDEVYYHDVPPGPGGMPLRRHGDYVERLPGGYFRIHGRADDTMNLGGIKVSSAEIERLLNGLPGISETAAIAIPTPGGGPSLLVIVAILSSGTTTSEIELKKLFQNKIRSELNPLFHVHKVHLVEKMPRTASNKVMRRELRDRFIHLDAMSIDRK